MINDNYKAIYSIINPEVLISELAKRYGFKAPFDCRLYKSGINDVYYIKTDNIVYYLRIANNGRTGYSLTDYKEEAFIVASLNENGVNTAVPMRCNDGEYVWSVNAPEGIRYAILFTEAKNKPSADSIKIHFNLGRSLAKIHTISDDNNYIISRMPLDFTQLIDRPLKLLKPYLGLIKQDDYTYICDFMADLQEYVLGKLPIEKPYYGFCHGDAQMGNVFFHDETPTFFDFDCMGYGWRSYDVSTHILHMEKQVPQYRVSKEYSAYIDGYNSIRRLDDNEIDCFTAFNAMSIMWAVGLNVIMFEKTMGYKRIEDFVNAMPGVFRVWQEKVFSSD